MKDCNGCEHFLEKNNQCKVCACFIDKMKECPIGKWKVKV